MSSEPEIAAYKLAEEVERFARVLGGREEAADLEELLRLEYGGDDAVLYALGEEDRAWTDLSSRSMPARTRKRSL